MSENPDIEWLREYLESYGVELVATHRRLGETPPYEELFAAHQALAALDAVAAALDAAQRLRDDYSRMVHDAAHCASELQAKSRQIQDLELALDAANERADENFAQAVAWKDERDAAIRERNEAKAIRQKRDTELERTLEELESAEAALEQTRAALRKYGWHDIDCPAIQAVNQGECSCGFVAALAAAPERQDAEEGGAA